MCFLKTVQQTEVRSCPLDVPIPFSLGRQLGTEGPKNTE